MKKKTEESKLIRRIKIKKYNAPAITKISINKITLGSGGEKLDGENFTAS